MRMLVVLFRNRGASPWQICNEERKKKRLLLRRSGSDTLFRSGDPRAAIESSKSCHEMASSHSTNSTVRTNYNTYNVVTGFSGNQNKDGLIASPLLT